MSDMTESTISGTGLRLLPKSFTPSINEVIIGRGRKVVNHSGNQRFQDLIHSHLNEYSKAKSKASKSAIIRRVLITVKEGSVIGGFVKQDASTKRWYAMEEASARISTAQAFRDALSGTYRSSKQYKQTRRWNMRTPGSSEVEEKKPTKTVVEQPLATSPADLVPAPRQGIAGLRGILSSALDLMDDSMFDDFDNAAPATSVPDLAESFAPEVTATPFMTTAEDDLSSLLARYETQVEITEDPFEPIPIKPNATKSQLFPNKGFSLFPQQQKGIFSAYPEHVVQKAAQASSGGSMSLRNALAM